MNTKYYEALGLHKRTQAGERSDAINGRLASEIIHSLEGMLEEDKVYSPCSESKIRGGGADAMTRCAWFRDCVPETARVNACLLSLAYSAPSAATRTPLSHRCCCRRGRECLPTRNEKFSSTCRRFLLSFSPLSRCLAVSVDAPPRC